MAPSDRERGGGGEDGSGEARPADGRAAKRRTVTRRWLEAAQQTNRLEFEREMERRRARFRPELERFWRARHPAG